MPKITKITAQKKSGRYNIFIDEQFAFGVTESVLIKYRLAKDLEIDSQLQRDIQKDDDNAKVLKILIQRCIMDKNIDIATESRTNWFERQFKIKASGSTIKTEIIAGITTFIAMSYILFVNPTILGDAGLDKGAVFVATALTGVVGCLAMAFIANYPIAVAPGLGSNAFFA